MAGIVRPSRSSTASAPMGRCCRRIDPRAWPAGSRRTTSRRRRSSCARCCRRAARAARAGGGARAGAGGGAAASELAIAARIPSMPICSSSSRPVPRPVRDLAAPRRPRRAAAPPARTGLGRGPRDPRLDAARAPPAVRATSDGCALTDDGRDAVADAGRRRTAARSAARATPGRCAARSWPRPPDRARPRRGPRRAARARGPAGARPSRSRRASRSASGRVDRWLHGHAGRRAVGGLRRTRSVAGAGRGRGRGSRRAIAARIRDRSCSTA